MRVQGSGLRVEGSGFRVESLGLRVQGSGQVAPEEDQPDEARVYYTVYWEGRYKATWKREFKIPWCKAGLLISMIKWTRTSRLSIKISLSLYTVYYTEPGPKT